MLRLTPPTARSWTAGFTCQVVKPHHLAASCASGPFNKANIQRGTHVSGERPPACIASK